jgi:hypothetical protein
MNFPVFSRKSGKRRNRDEFADDCLHRHANVFLLHIHLVTPRLATVVSSLATDMFMADSARRFWSAALV